MSTTTEIRTFARTLLLPCGDCHGEGRGFDADRPTEGLVACPLCQGTGLVRVAATSHALAYLSGARGLRELLVLLGSLETKADARAKVLGERGEREAANLALQEAQDWQDVRQALARHLQPVFDHSDRLRKKVPAPRGAQAFRPPAKG